MAEELVGRVVRTNDMETIIGTAGTDLVCPNCGDYLEIMSAPYGWYATCRRDRVRWSHIRGEDGITAERYHPTTEWTNASM